jgi:hypothetical protein
MNVIGKRVVPAPVRCAPSKSAKRSGNYQIDSTVPVDLAEEIRHLQERVAIVLQKAEMATRTLAA